MKPFWRIFYHKPRKKFQVLLRFKGRPMQYSGTYHTQIGAMIGRNQEIFKLLGPGGLAKAWKLRPRSGKPRPSPLVDPSTLEPPSKVISDESKNLDKFFKILNPSKGEPSND